MAKNNEYKCYRDLVKYRNQIIQQIVGIIKDLKNGKKWSSILLSRGIAFLFFGDFTSNCRVADLGTEAMEFIEPTGIYRLGSNMVGNSQILQTYADEFVRASNLDGKLIAVGKMLKLITGLWVY